MKIMHSVFLSDRERTILRNVSQRCHPEWAFSEEDTQHLFNRMREERKFSLKQIRELFELLRRLYKHYTADLERTPEGWGIKPESAAAAPGVMVAQLTAIHESRREQLALIEQAREVLARAIAILDAEFNEDEDTLEFE